MDRWWHCWVLARLNWWQNILRSALWSRLSTPARDPRIYSSRQQYLEQSLPRQWDPAWTCQHTGNLSADVNWVVNVLQTYSIKIKMGGKSGIASKLLEGFTLRLSWRCRLTCSRLSGQISACQLAKWTWCVFNALGPVESMPPLPE